MILTPEVEFSVELSFRGGTHLDLPFKVPLSCLARERVRKGGKIFSQRCRRRREGNVRRRRRRQRKRQQVYAAAASTLATIGRLRRRVDGWTGGRGRTLEW